MRIVVFDLDGTLADTSGDLLAAANATFAELDLDVALQRGADDGVALRGGKAMLSLGLTRLQINGASAEHLIERGYPMLLAQYSEAIDLHTRLYPGVIEAVERLRSQGDRAAICTNKPEALAEKLMVSLGARDLFDSLIGADTLPVRKPSPEPFHEAVSRAGGSSSRACLVGDSDTDRDTAKAARVPSVLVTFGPSGEDMAALKPEALLHDYGDLDAVVDQLLPVD